MWILIIDDDTEDIDFFSEVVVEILHDCRCVPASSCEEGLISLGDKHELPSHIFLDGMLYGMSSKECLLKLKADKRLKNVDVILYSGYVSPDFQREFLALGAHLCLQKPANRNELVDALTKIFKK